jgi:hypothetical protein
MITGFCVLDVLVYSTRLRTYPVFWGIRNFGETGQIGVFLFF